MLQNNSQQPETNDYVQVSVLKERVQMCQSEPFKELEKLIVSGMLAHGDNPRKHRRVHFRRTENLHATGNQVSAENRLSALD